LTEALTEGRQREEEEEEEGGRRRRKEGGGGGGVSRGFGWECEFMFSLFQ